MYKFTNDKLPIIFSDVDNTLYDHSKKPKEETIEDIKFAQNNGAHFNICTGNPYFERMKSLSKSIEANYLICSTGAQIIDAKKQKTIFISKIENNIFAEIIKIAKMNDLQLCFWDEENYFLLNNYSSWNDEILEYHFIDEITKKSFPKFYNNENISPLKIEIYSKSYKNKNEVELELKTIFKLFEKIKNIDITLTSINIEIQAKNTNKGQAILWLIENIYKNYNITNDDVMVIGDSNNDYSMIQISKYSYAMANASELILKNANYFTSAVEQNGLGEAILDYLYRFKNIIRKYLLHF